MYQPIQKLNREIFWKKWIRQNLKYRNESLPKTERDRGVMGSDPEAPPKPSYAAGKGVWVEENW